jgi:hypothetical protein
MTHIHDSLLELHRLYGSDTLEEYEKQWHIVAEQIEHAFPGFTIAYAEVYLGISRQDDGGMRHVLVPKRE